MDTLHAEDGGAKALRRLKPLILQRLRSQKTGIETRAEQWDM